MKNTLLTLNLVCLLGISIFAQEIVPKRQYQTTSIGNQSAPKIDGLINDKAWELVKWSGNYVEWSPEENTAPTEQSQLKILYDDKNIFVAFRCFDKDPAGIVKRLSRRDGFDGDWVEINIASLGDERTAYSFTISVSGVKGEEFITNNGAFWDNTWNPIWYAKTHIDEAGWTAEIRIPFSQLRFNKDAEQVWGIQSTRRYFRKEERSVWQRSPQSAAGWVSSFGELHGLKNLQPQRQLELQPYLVGALETYEAETGNPFRDGRDNRLSVGLDGKIGITNDVTLDFTVNPDFGQVEADPSAIALDGFQIFFPEQRPFFIENKNIFDYRFSSSVQNNRTFGFDNLFYSRRIGRAPQGFPNIQSTEYSEQRNITTILGAAKLSGKTKTGWSIGILETLTQNEKITITDGVSERKESVEPLTNYFVSRIQKDFNQNNTFIGGIFTATNRNLAPNLNFLHQSAYTGGLDFTHQWKNRAYYVNGNFVFSNVNGSVEAINRTQRSITHLFQREGATHIQLSENKTALTGTGGRLQIGKASGNWRFQTGGTWRSPELELNDLGFQLRADDIRHYGWLSYRTTQPLKKLRSWLANYNHVAAFDFGGNLNELLVNANTWINLKNNAWINFFTNIKLVNFSNYLLRGGPRIKLPSEFSIGGFINSDTRKKLRFGTNYTFTWMPKNALNRLSLGGNITYQPTNALQVALFPNYSTVNDKLQYVITTSSNGYTRYIIAEIEQKTLSFPLRIDYILTPNLSIQYWGQPFISRGRYSNFKYITNPTAAKFEDRFALLSDAQQATENGNYSIDENLDGVVDYSFYDPNFSFVQWRSNAVLRWEYIPGSELFLVWSQDISQFANPEDGLFTGLESGIIDTKPRNIFLIKATYRFIK